MTAIIEIKVGTHYRERFGIGSQERGEYVTTSDGAVWFHPYNGRAPVCVIAKTGSK